MLNEFKKHLSKNFPFLLNSKLLIACSGGIDSMVLVELCQRCKLDFSVAHCNYKLRSAASDLDSEFVVSWAESHGRPVFVKEFDLGDSKGSIQLEARNLRYQWFEQILMDNQMHYILTAHHSDDSLETFFINLSRGTGLVGLTGIPSTNKQVIRPLLPFSRKEIASYAQSENISWREDESNSELKYVRNQIRHELVPKFKDIQENFESNFRKTQDFLGQSAVLLEEYTKLLKRRLFQEDQNGITISCKELMQLNPLQAHLHLLFKGFGFTQWNDLQDLITAQSGKEICSRTHRLLKDRNSIILTKITTPDLEGDIFWIDKNLTEIQLPIPLKIEKVQHLAEVREEVAFVDKEKLNYPLNLRKWKIGDYFYPLGMKGQKKLSKFFKDEKFNTLEKESQWLLCSDDQIVWVVGKRLDDRFKVSSRTKEIVKITWVK